MLLAIDIGNSNISVGLFDKAGKLLFLSSIDTDSRKTDQHRPDESVCTVPL